MRINRNIVFVYHLNLRRVLHGIKSYVDHQKSKLTFYGLVHPGRFGAYNPKEGGLLVLDEQ